jgi:hypothetical protein
VRRILGYVAFTFGLVLIFLSPLLRFYATPRVEKAPYDVYDRTVSVGSGSYFSVAKLAVVGPTGIENISIAKGDPKESTHAVAVIGIFSRTFDTNAGDVDVGYSVYAFDRTTGYGVDCCGANPVAHGLTLKFPFGTRKGTYPYWDGTAKRAFPATYTRTEPVDGITAYVFVSRIPPTSIGTETIPGFLAGQKDRASITVERFYQATTTLWVEPTTGAIVKAGQRNQQWFADTVGTRLLTLADIDVVNDEASVQDTVDQVKGRLWQLRLVRTWLPIAAPLVGLALAIAGWWWLLRTDARTDAVSTEPDARSAAENEPARAVEPGAASTAEA